MSSAEIDAESVSLGKLTDEVNQQYQVRISNKCAVLWNLGDNRDVTVPLTLLPQLPSLWIARAQRRVIFIGCIYLINNVKITFFWDVIMCVAEECTASDPKGGGSTFLLVSEFLPVHGIALQKMIILQQLQSGSA